MISEDQLEKLALDWFQGQGYDYNYGPDIAPDGDDPKRTDYRQVVLLGHLLSALQAINPNIPFERLEEVAAVVAKPDDTWGEVPCAFIELLPGADADADALDAHCLAVLARFKRPRAYVFSEIPKTSTGKVQKFVLRERARAL